MCGFGRHINKYDSSKFMHIDNFFNIFSKIKNNTQSIRLNGRGESVIHKDFVTIFEYVYKEKIHINLFTNLSFHKQNIIDVFFKTEPQLYISIDSPYKYNLEKIRVGSNFEFILDNLENLQTLNKRPFIVFTLQDENYQEIEAICDFALKYRCNLIYNVLRKDNGIESFQKIIIKNLDNIKKAFLNIQKSYKNSNLTVLIPNQISGINIFNTNTTCGTKDKCPKIRNELCILYDGNVIPCNMFNPYKIGNIINQTLEEILSSKELSLFEANHKENDYCKNCACLV